MVENLRRMDRARDSSEVNDRRYLIRNKLVPRVSVKKRTAAIVLELIIGLPVLIIALMAIVELGLLSSNQAMVHAASRAAADAAVGVGCDMPTDGEVPSEILEAVEKVLEARGMTASCIRVEHTNGPDPPYVLTLGVGGAAPMVVPSTDNYVCVSVCVENTELAPNLLEVFCVDLDGSYSQQTVCRCFSCRDDDDGGGGGEDPEKIGDGFIPGTAGGRPPRVGRSINFGGTGGGNIGVELFSDGTWTSNDGIWEGMWEGDPASGSVTITSVTML